MKPSKKSVNNYAKYSGIVIQMAVIIALGIWGGKALDDYMENEKPIMTAVGAITSIFVAMFYVFQQVKK